MGASTCRVQALKTVSLLIYQSCTYYNARSLTTKIDELRAMVEENHPDANCVVESWLFKEILDNQELTIDNYQLTRLDCIRHGVQCVVYGTSQSKASCSFCMFSLQYSQVLYYLILPSSKLQPRDFHQSFFSFLQ